MYIDVLNIHYSRFCFSGFTYVLIFYPYHKHFGFESDFGNPWPEVKKI